MHAKLRKKQYSKAKKQEKSQKLIIFYKKNNILHLFLRNLDFFVNFAGKVQYNTLLDMKIQEVMDIFGMEVKYEIRQTVFSYLFYLYDL